MTKPFLLLLVAFLAGCASLPQEKSDLAPTGKLRAAINYGNPVLASRGPGGEAQGVSVDLARELAKRLGVPVELIPFNAAGKVVEAGRAGVWDVAFVALDPKRAAEIEQSPPYVLIEGSYLVREGSPLRANEEVDRRGRRVAVGRGSVYDLYLTRSLKEAEIVRAPTSPAVVDFFLKENLDVAAGVKQQLESDAKRVGGVRLLPGHFMVISQAMATQKADATKGKAGARYVRDFIEEMKASGFVAQALERHDVHGALVAPKGDAPH